MNYITTDIADKKIKGNRTVTTEDIIKELIDEHSRSSEKRMMEEGVAYFKNRPDILNRKIYYYNEKGVKKEDDTAANNKLPHNWHKLLVRQKMDYMVGKPMVFSDREVTEDEKGEQVSPNGELLKHINKLLGEDWDDTVNELVKGAANKGVEWLHIYIDENGDFRYMVVDARQIIGIWEASRQQRLQALIHYYTVYINGDERIRAEYWTPEDVSYFVTDDSGIFMVDTIENSAGDNVAVHPQGHFYVVKEFDGVEEERWSKGWGRIPFIPFKNNEEMLPDLNDYKQLVDDYNKVRSDLSNNLEDIQDTVIVIKNYIGANAGPGPAENNLRYHKLVDSMDKLEINTPIKTQESHIKQLIEDIYKFAMGVNIDTDRFGDLSSGVVLKFLYSVLDLKCDTTKRKFIKAIKKELFWFIKQYLIMTKQMAEKDINTDDIDVTFNSIIL
ncbi:phage portal protein [Halocella sp. SP3-1]|uniref:phage portal protein n=1 Tax=Halocella sp. SP3-1 TaxID=2382161 RepID=UPI000F753B21|nr:phage portal protein [Halocella sp. SP3-1]AZO96092.1 phage portal protein [Halocella sp. SP3-1]